MAASSRPSTAQERILAANRPPPPPPPPAIPTHKQLSAINRNGNGVSQVLFVKTNSAEAEEKRVTTHTTVSKSKYRNTSELIVGPSEPGHIRRGVRRFEAQDECTVGKALTEEWIRGYGDEEDPPVHVVRQRGPKDNLEGNCCRILTEEAKPRKMRAPGNAPPHTSRAPYSEPDLNDLYVSSEQNVPRRQYVCRDNGNIICPDPLPHGTVLDDRPRGTVRSHCNRSNMSVDVLNLGQYTREELNEVERKIVAGPRAFTPPPLPPRQRALISRVRTNANVTHDIFGTGNGVDDAEPIHCKRNGECAPKRADEFSIFDTTPLPQKPVKEFYPSDLLAYNEPRVSAKELREKAAREARMKPVPCTAFQTPGSNKIEGRVERGLLYTPKSSEIVARGGRARGTYAPKACALSLY
ncbi:hypothetical protein ERJ75_000042100 [Trypanosoma vivax]|uniref:Flagellum targeting protein kharon1 n=1 Tax=Trypanosoma vivax (strain Y486) TaxID=1055687 RepID=G0U7H4_TRYVY|nr:hypothetical protein ERJ75_000042100 [Trypanosoma vivax]CCC51832.1 conserved hypothetical protein [Trypanosoma vivax Y486]